MLVASDLERAKLFRFSAPVSPEYTALLTLALVLPYCDMGPVMSRYY